MGFIIKTLDGRYKITSEELFVIVIPTNQEAGIYMFIAGTETAGTRAKGYFHKSETVQFTATTLDSEWTTEHHEIVKDAIKYFLIGTYSSNLINVENEGEWNLL